MFAGTQVHSLRLPGFVVSTEVVFASAGERLSLRHDAGLSPEPYVAGTLLAAAYGLTVSANMMLTTLLLLGVATRVWKWDWRKVAPSTMPS